MIIYLADLSHDNLKQTQSLFTPTGIGFIASYSKKYLGDKVDIKLFKSVEKLLVAVEERKPDLIGFSNYTWNKELATWAGKKIRLECPDTPIVMGGPNISTDEIEVQRVWSCGIRDITPLDIKVMLDVVKKTCAIISIRSLAGKIQCFQQN